MGGEGRFAGDGGPAAEASLNSPMAVALAPDGSLYIADHENRRVRKVAPDGIITTVFEVPKDSSGWMGENAPGRDADQEAWHGGRPRWQRWGGPKDVVVAPDGTVYTSNGMAVFKIEPDADAYVVAGTGEHEGTLLEGVDATIVPVHAGALAMGPDGTLYIGDAGARVRRLAPDGTITTIAGIREGGYYGDGGPALNASLDGVNGLAFAPDGSLFIAGRHLRKIDTAGIIGTVEFGSDCYGDGGPAVYAELDDAGSIALGHDGSIYIGGNGVSLRRVSPDGIIETVAGRRSSGLYGRDESWEEWDDSPPQPTRLALADDGTLYISDGTTIRKRDRAGRATVVAGTGRHWYWGDGGPAVEASVDEVEQITLGPDGSLYLADRNNQRIRRISPDGIITTVAGSGPSGRDTGGFSGDGGPATEARLKSPSGITVRNDGTLYIADAGNEYIRKVDRNGIISVATRVYGAHSLEMGPHGTLYIMYGRLRKIDPQGRESIVAGEVRDGFSGDGGPAAKAGFGSFADVDVAPDGSIYVADRDNHRIRRINRRGMVTTVAGSGPTGYDVRQDPGPAGDGGPATKARLFQPTDVEVAADGTLYIGQAGGRVRRVDAKGVITSIYGWRPPLKPEEPVTDNVLATRVSNLDVDEVAVGPDGLIYLSGLWGVRKIDREGIVRPVAGVTALGGLGDGGPALKAGIYSPGKVAFGPDGCLYIPDNRQHRIRKVDANGIITTVAGSGPTDREKGAFAGDGGPATEARLNGPASVAVGPDGSLYIADTVNHRVRKVDPEGIITTIAGDGWMGPPEPMAPDGWRPGRSTGDGDVAVEASLNTPVAVGTDGSIYIAEFWGHRIRRVDTNGIITTVAGDGWRAEKDDRGRFRGEGGPATEASLDLPSDIVVAPDGTLYICDRGNRRIRKVCP